MSQKLRMIKMKLGREIFLFVCDIYVVHIRQTLKWQKTKILKSIDNMSIQKKLVFWNTFKLENVVVLIQLEVMIFTHLSIILPRVSKEINNTLSAL